MPFLLSILLLFLLPYGLTAQEVLKVKNYGVDQGLPQSTVWDIVQDDFGFLWVSTSDGLCRFDGYSFNTYRNDPSDSLSIGGNSSHQMAIDRQGDLWLTHDQGFSMYKKALGNFYSLFKYDVIQAEGFNKTIGEDNHGYMWVWIRGEGLLKFDKKTAQRVGTFPMTDPVLNDQYSREALLDQQGTIWITLAGTSLISFNTTSEKFQLINTKYELNGMCAVSDSILLIGTKIGLLRYNTVKGQIENLPFHEKRRQASSTYLTNKIIRVNEKEFWVGTDKGIFVYDDQQRNFKHHYTSIAGGKENFLFAQTLFMDRSGNIWVGTNGDGLKKHSPKTSPWKHYKSDSDRGDIVKSIYDDGHDLLFVGYFDNGLDIFSKSKGLIRKIRKGDAPWLIPSDWVYSLMGIDEARIFISFAEVENQFGIFNNKTQTFNNLTPNVLSLAGIQNATGNHYPVAVPYHDGILFTCREVLIYATFKDKENPELRALKQFPNELITCVHVDSDQTIWVGTMNGYYVNRNGNKEWKKGNSNLTHQIKTICEDIEGKIWMGSISGLYILNKEEKIEKTLRMGNLLINDFIYGILRDNHGDMWFSHNKGLTRYDHKKKLFRDFSVDDGLQSNEFNTGAYFKSATGELFFGGINGTNSFYPEDIKDNPQIPIVQLTRIDLNDRPYVTDTVYWAQKKLTLDYTNNTLAFEFAGLEFTEPGKNQYAWRMSGIDRDWVLSGNNRFTRYANMPPGDYHFEVKASNNDGIWNEIPTTLQIEIIPPYWQTWWFTIVLVVITITLIATTAYLVSRQRYRGKLIAQELQQKIKLEEMKRLQDERNRISRDLHDNVGSMVSFVSTKIDWVLKHKNINEDAVDDLQQVKENAHEIMLGLRETIWTLHDKIITNTDLADKLKVYIKSHLLIPYDIQDDIKSEMNMGNEVVLNIYRCCQEVVNNINKHSEATRVTIEFKNSQTTCFEMSLNDNGKGLSKEDLNKEDHYGLNNLRLRLQEVGAIIEIESSQNKGTCIKIIYG